jgi:predicted metal-dependent enzyme (double-stranded beta helix superfamily)
METLIYKLQQHFESDKSFDDAKQYLNNINLNWQIYKPEHLSNYQRVLVYQNENFDIFYIFWEKDAVAKIHNHAGNGCIMKTLHGQLKENIYNPQTLKYLTSNILDKNTISYIHDKKSYHSIQNITADMSVSLHIYSPPNFKTSYFS